MTIAILIICTITYLIFMLQTSLEKGIDYKINFNNKQAFKYGKHYSETNNEIIRKEKEILDILSFAHTYKEKDYVYFVGTKLSIHRWIMQTYILERSFHKGEVVHHINGIKSDNRITNLKLFPNQYEHDLHHRKNAKLNGYWHDRLPEFANYQKFIEYAL